MCLIIAKPAGSIVPIEQITNAHGYNPDGLGISIRDLNTNHIRVFKYLSIGEFIATHEFELLDPEVEAVIHLRMATHGAVRIENVHPFVTSHGYALHHNGIIDIAPLLPGKTDSETYTRAIIDPLEYDFHKSSEIIASLGAQIPGSKLAIHTNDGITLVNEHYGHWLDGLWYSSNASWYSGDKTCDSDNYAYLEPDLLDLLKEELPNFDPLRKARLLREVEGYLNAYSDFNTDTWWRYVN